MNSPISQNNFSLENDVLIQSLEGQAEDAIVTDIRGTGNEIQVKTASNTFFGKIFSWIWGNKPQISADLKAHLTSLYGEEIADFASQNHPNTAPLTVGKIRQMDRSAQIASQAEKDRPRWEALAGKNERAWDNLANTHPSILSVKSQGDDAMKVAKEQLKQADENVIALLSLPQESKEASLVSSKAGTTTTRKNTIRTLENKLYGTEEAQHQGKGGLLKSITQKSNTAPEIEKYKREVHLEALKDAANTSSDTDEKWSIRKSWANSTEEHLNKGTLHNRVPHDAEKGALKEILKAEKEAAAAYQKEVTRLQGVKVYFRSAKGKTLSDDFTRAAYLQNPHIRNNSLFE